MKLSISPSPLNQYVLGTHALAVLARASASARMAQYLSAVSPCVFFCLVFCQSCGGMTTNQEVGPPGHSPGAGDVYTPVPICMPTGGLVNVSVFAAMYSLACAWRASLVNHVKIAW